MAEFDRITRNPAAMQGKACLRVIRVPVGMILGLIGSGVTIERLLHAYPYIEREDVLQSLIYGSYLAGAEREIELAA
jgi:uncharacterized protein (DUF433 family)